MSRNRSAQQHATWGQWLLLVVLIAINLVPTFLLINSMAHQAVPWGIVATQCVVGLVLLMVPAVVLPVRWWMVLGGVTWLLCLFELASWLSIGEPLTYTLYSSMRTTGWGAAAGQIQVYWLPALLYVLALVAYFVLSFRCFPARFYLFRRRIRWLLILGACGVCAPLVAIRFAPGEGKLEGGIRQYKEVLRIVVGGVPTLKTALYTMRFQSQQASTQQILAQRASMPIEGVEHLDTVPVLGVLVIGETSRACNWQLAGYERPTNPRLSKRGDVYFFPDAYSPSNCTVVAAPMLVSTSTPADEARWMQEPFLTEVLNRAGLVQQWVTLQTYELWSSLAMRACTSTLQIDARFPKRTPYDGVLLPHAKQFVDTVQGPGFLVLHPYGGHFQYTERYPESFAQFKPELSRSVEGFNQLPDPSRREVFVNSFDNTIAYTDMMLDSLIGILERTHRPAFLLYVADHGENLYDDANQEILHCNARPSHYTAHVPFLVWLSPEYRAAFPRQDSILASHKGLPIQTTCTFHTLLDLVRVRYGGMDRSRSLLDSTFTPVQPRTMVTPAGDGIYPEPPYPTGEQSPCPATALRGSTRGVNAGGDGASTDPR